MMKTDKEIAEEKKLAEPKEPAVVEEPKQEDVAAIKEKLKQAEAKAAMLEEDIAAVRKEGGQSIHQLQFERKVRNNWEGVDYSQPWVVVLMEVKDSKLNQLKPAHGKMKLPNYDKVLQRSQPDDYPRKDYKNFPDWIVFDKGVGVTNNFLVARELINTHHSAGGITEYDPIEGWSK